MASITVIIPMKNAERTLERCLTALFASSLAPLEVILVDDGSSDSSPRIAERFDVTLLRNEGPGGVASARNRGAREARGDILFFTDSDVVLRPTTIARVAQRLEDPRIDGVVGVQTEEPAFTNFSSDYKNLWLRYTYLKLDGDLSVLYSSVVAIRKRAFVLAEGFDSHYQRPNIEDTDLGKRLADRGARLRVDPEVEVLHIKHYDLRSLLLTDFRRSSGLLKVQLRDGFRKFRRGNYTSIPTSFVASVVLAWLAPAVLLWPGLPAGARWGGGGALALAIPLLLNDLLRFLARVRGPLFVLKTLLLLPLDFAAISLGLLHGLAAYLAGRRW